MTAWTWGYDAFANLGPRISVAPLHQQPSTMEAAATVAVVAVVEAAAGELVTKTVEAIERQYQKRNIIRLGFKKAPGSIGCGRPKTHERSQ